MMCERACAEYLCQRGIDRAETGKLARAWEFGTVFFEPLLLHRQFMSRVPDRVRERRVLREQ